MKIENTSDDVFENLASAIIKQAVADWMTLCNDIKKPENPFKPRAKRPYSFASLRRFFKSDWCATLCRDANPQCILSKLEQGRINALKTRRVNHEV